MVANASGIQNIHWCLNKELDDICIKYGNIKQLKINTTAKHLWGCCTQCPDGNYIIEISQSLLDDNISDIATKTTIVHELLHSVNGCNNHTELWKILAAKVNSAYGYNVKRTTSYAEKGIEAPEKKAPLYEFVCEKCGQKISYRRKCKFVKNFSHYKCGKCGGNFKAIY